MGLKLYLLYCVLVLQGSDSEFFSHAWDFGKSLFDGDEADPRTPSETHPVVMMRRLIFGEAARGSRIDARVSPKNGGIAWMQLEFWESMLIDLLGVDDI